MQKISDVAIPTNIKFSDFYKAVQILAVRKGFSCKPYKGKKASAFCFEFFKDNNEIPVGVFCVHEDKQAGVIYSDDLKKACKQLEVDKKDFELLIRNKFKI